MADKATRHLFRSGYLYRQRGRAQSRQRCLHQIHIHRYGWLRFQEGGSVCAGGVSGEDRVGYVRHTPHHRLRWGLHCYWPLLEAADISTWKPIAENFKRLCKQEGLNIDQTVTADAARVLRIPGTFNNKAKYVTPRPVQFMLQGSGPIDLKQFGAAVRGKVSEAFAPVSNAFVATSIQLDGVRPTKAQHKNLLR